MTSGPPPKEHVKDHIVSFSLPTHANGILPDRMIAAMADDGLILPAYPFVESQIQPASLDLRLGDIAYRVRASFLPGPGATVAERIDELKLHEIDLSDGAVLETNCVYIVPLLESLALPPQIVAAANPKSSTGRLDVFTRVIADGTRRFDMIGAGYHGQLYILASKEAVQVPPDYAAEMVPFDPLVGEFRVHYAGFFDPGFGYAGAGGQGARAVLEVRSREVPFILEHGQIVGRLVYEKMLSRPASMYGQRIGSNYQAQGLKLSKHFRV